MMTALTALWRGWLAFWSFMARALTGPNGQPSTPRVVGFMLGASLAWGFIYHTLTCGMSVELAWVVAALAAACLGVSLGQHFVRAPQNTPAPPSSANDHPANPQPHDQHADPR